MEKNKFVKLLKKLNNQDLDGFHAYLKQFHAGEKVALRTFEYLIKLYPKFDQKKLRVDYAYKRIFKMDIELDSHGKKKMQNTASLLKKWLKNFLILSKAQQNGPIRQVIWLSILNELGVKKEFFREAEAFYSQTRKSAFRSPADALPNFMASYYYRKSLSIDSPLINANLIRQCTETMIDCWEIIRLEMASEMSLLRRTEDQVPRHKVKVALDFQQSGLVQLKQIYEALWQLTDSGEENNFIQLESLLSLYGQDIDPGELEGIIRYAYNFTAGQSRNAKETAQAERTHRLNKVGLKLGVFSQDGNLPSSAFSNIVTVASQAKDFPWAAEFVKDYGHVLPEDQRDEAIRLANAVIAFESGKFQEVLKLLEPVNFKALFDVFRSKCLLIRSYYELQIDQETIFDACDYLESLLRRSRKTEIVKATLAFVLILKMLVAQRSSKKVILSRIEKANSIYFRTWLIEKAEHYKARHAERNLSPE